MGSDGTVTRLLRLLAYSTSCIPFGMSMEGFFSAEASWDTQVLHTTIGDTRK